MTIFFRRILRAAKLESSFYRQVGTDQTTMDQAVLVVILSGFAAGLGVFLRVGWVRMMAFISIELVLWSLWVVLMYLMATKLLPRPDISVGFGTFLRTVGFSSAPGLLRVVGLLPKAELLVFFVALVWMLMAAIVAVKEVFQYTGIWQAVAVCVMAWVIVRIVQRLAFALI